MINTREDVIQLSKEFNRQFKSLNEETYLKDAPVLFARFHAILLSEEWADEIKSIKGALYRMFTGEISYDYGTLLCTLLLGETDGYVSKDLARICGDMREIVRGPEVLTCMVNQLVTDGIYTSDTLPSRYEFSLDPELKIIPIS